jgi:hypothetical protein
LPPIGPIARQGNRSAKHARAGPGEPWCAPPPTDLRVPWWRVPTQTRRRAVSQPKPACPQPQEQPSAEPRQSAVPGGGRTSARRRRRRNGGDRHGGLGAHLRVAAALLRCLEGSREGVVVVDVPGRLRARVAWSRILQTPPELSQYQTTTGAGDQPARRGRTLGGPGPPLVARGPIRTARPRRCLSCRAPARATSSPRPQRP